MFKMIWSIWNTILFEAEVFVVCCDDCMKLILIWYQPNGITISLSLVSSGLSKLISFCAQSTNRWLIRKLFVGMAKCWSICWRVEPSAIGLAYGGSGPTSPLGNTWTGGGTIAAIGIGFPLKYPFFNSSFNHFFSCQCSSSLCSNNLYFESSNSLSLCKTRCPSSIGPPSIFCSTFLLSFHLISIAYW